jgi:hypothetical protein
LPDLSLELQRQLTPEPPPNQESRLSDSLYAGLCRDWVLFRETQMAKTLWYYPSQKDFFQSVLERVVGKNDEMQDIEEAALLQKIAPYYQPYFWEKDALPLQRLQKILDQWAQLHISVTVVLTPQNRKFLGSYLDSSSFEKNRKTLALLMKTKTRPGFSYEDWSGRYPSAFFLDHCHLNPEGNEQYALDLTRLLIGGGSR